MMKPSAYFAAFLIFSPLAVSAQDQGSTQEKKPQHHGELRKETECRSGQSGCHGVVARDGPNIIGRINDQMAQTKKSMQPFYDSEDSLNTLASDISGNSSAPQAARDYFNKFPEYIKGIDAAFKSTSAQMKASQGCIGNAEFRGGTRIRTDCFDEAGITDQVNAATISGPHSMGAVRDEIQAKSGDFRAGMHAPGECLRSHKDKKGNWYCDERCDSQHEQCQEWINERLQAITQALEAMLSRFSQPAN